MVKNESLVLNVFRIKHSPNKRNIKSKTNDIIVYFWFNVINHLYSSSVLKHNYLPLTCFINVRLKPHIKRLIKTVYKAFFIIRILACIMATNRNHIYWPLEGLGKTTLPPMKHEVKSTKLIINSNPWELRWDFIKIEIKKWVYIKIMQLGFLNIDQ